MKNAQVGHMKCPFWARTGQGKAVILSSELEIDDFQDRASCNSYNRLNSSSPQKFKIVWGPHGQGKN